MASVFHIYNIEEYPYRWFLNENKASILFESTPLGDSDFWNST